MYSWIVIRSNYELWWQKYGHWDEISLYYLYFPLKWPFGLFSLIVNTRTHLGMLWSCFLCIPMVNTVFFCFSVRLGSWKYCDSRICASNGQKKGKYKTHKWQLWVNFNINEKYWRIMKHNEVYWKYVI